MHIRVKSPLSCPHELARKYELAQLSRNARTLIVLVPGMMPTQEVRVFDLHGGPKDLVNSGDQTSTWLL